MLQEATGSNFESGTKGAGGLLGGKESRRGVVTAGDQPVRNQTKYGRSSGRDPAGPCDPQTPKAPKAPKAPRPPLFSFGKLSPIPARETRDACSGGSLSHRLSPTQSSFVVFSSHRLPSHSSNWPCCIARLRSDCQMPAT